MNSTDARTHTGFASDPQATKMSARHDKPVARTCTEITPNRHHTSGSDVAINYSKPLSAFRSKPVYVLLGDSGAGKTTEFQRECEAVGDTAVMLTAREFITFNVDSHPEWRNRTLFLDGLDEIRAGKTDARVPLDDIRAQLDSLGRPSFRISCREADWIGNNDWQSLKDVSPDKEVTVLRLDPLNEHTTRELLSTLENTSDAQAQEFIEQARHRGIDSMLNNPLTLKLLFKTIVHAGEGDTEKEDPKAGEWPDSRLKIFEAGCHRMAAEHNDEHRAAVVVPQAQYPPLETLIDRAGYLCALLLLCDLDGYTRTPNDSTNPLNALKLISSDSISDDVSALTQFKYALATNLFTATGEGGFKPVHRQIAEFLAGRYLAKRIAKTDGYGPSAGRVTALLANSSTGGVPTPLRGLSAWLAAHSSKIRERLIRLDPVGVGLYGDIKVFTFNEKEHLLTSLRTFAERADLSGHQQYNGRGNVHKEDTAWAFRSLASEDMVPAIKTLLNRGCVTSSEERFLEFLLRILSQADESQPGTLTALAPDLLEVLRDPTSSPLIKSAALEAYIHIAPQGTDKTIILKQLLEEVHSGVFPDPRDDIRAILLCNLYPNEIKPSQVWRYLVAQNHNLSGENPEVGGRFWMFLHRDILRLSRDSHVKELLCTLSEQVLRPTGGTPLPQKTDAHFEHCPHRTGGASLPQETDAQEQLRDSPAHVTPIYDPNSYNFDDLNLSFFPSLILPIKLLERALKASDSNLDPSCLYDWLKTTNSFPPSYARLENIINSIRTWFEARPRIQKTIYRTWLQRRNAHYDGNDLSAIYEYPPCTAMYGSRPSVELGLWCLKKALEVFNTDIAASEALLEGAHKSLEEQEEREQSLTMNLAQSEGTYESLEEQDRRTRGQAALKWQFEKLAEARDAGEFSHAGQGSQWIEKFKQQIKPTEEEQPHGFAGWLEHRIERTEGEEQQKLIEMRRERHERMEKAEKKKQQLIEGWAKLIRSQETELRENRFSPRNLRILAGTYFGLFRSQDDYASPRDRISSLIGGDPNLVDAVMIGLRHAVERGDIPEVDEMIAYHNQSREPWLAYPVLASLHLLSEENPARLGRLSSAQKCKALTIHYCFSFHMRVGGFGGMSAVKPSAVWHHRLFKQEPDLVLDVLYRCASSGMRAGLENPPGIHDLDDLERVNSRSVAEGETTTDDHVPSDSKVNQDASSLNTKMHNMRLRLLETYPVRARNNQMESLDCLIAKVLQSSNKPDDGFAFNVTQHLSTLADKKLALKSMSPAQRVRWLVVDLLVPPHQQNLEKLEAYVTKNEIRIRHLAESHCNSERYGYPILSFLSDCQDPVILKDAIRMLGYSFNPLLKSGQVTPAMEMSEIIVRAINQLGSLTTGEAHEALTTLIEDSRLERWHSRLRRAREEQLVIYRDASYQHPDISQVQAVLSDQVPADAADLAALLRDWLSGIAEDLQGDNSNLWRQFWNEDSHRRPLSPKPEDSCRDALLTRLKERLPSEIDAVPEGRYASDKRADIRVSFGGFNVPIEIKKNSDKTLWSSIREQLLNRYTTDPATSGYGIFIVLWFGEQETVKPPNGKLPSTAEELKRQLIKTLPDDETRTISVVVLDVTKPGNQLSSVAGLGR